MRLLRAAALLACAALMTVSWTGCSHLTMLRTEELRQVQARVDSVGTQLIQVQQEISRQQKEHHELLRLIRADQQVRFSELESKISNLEGNISESQQRLSSIDQKTQELKKRWEETGRGDGEGASSAELSKLFQVAHSDFMARRYDLALSGFRDIKTQSPESPLAEEATYWIAECFYARNKLAEAEAAYKEYLKDYPKGKQVCAGLFKLGLIYETQKKDRSKDMVWNKLLESCADAPEAKSVRERTRRR